MAAQKVLYNNAGQIQEYQAKDTTGVAGDIPALDSTGKLNSAYMPVGVEIETQTFVASEAISAGAFVNIWNSAGTMKIRNADNTTTGKEANGFVLASVANGASGTVYRKGLNTQLAGLTLGSTYYLGAAGAATLTCPSTTGNVIQILGKADSATELYFLERNTIVSA